MLFRRKRLGMPRRTATAANAVADGAVNSVVGPGQLLSPGSTLHLAQITLLHSS